MKARKLFWNYAFLLMVILLSFIALTIYLERKTRSLLVVQSRELMNKSGHLMARSFPPQLLNNPEKADSYLKKTAPVTGIRLSVILPDGTVIADSEHEPALMNNHNDRPEIISARERGTGYSIRHSATLGISFLYCAYDLEREAGADKQAVFRVAIPIEDLFLVTRNLSISFAVSAFFVLIILTVSSLVSFRSIISSITRLRDAASQYASGNFEHRAYIDNPVELVTLSRVMHGMSTQLRNHIDTIVEQKEELETVLAGMAEGVVLLDQSMMIKTINSAALELVPMTEKEAAGKSLIEVFRNSLLHDFAKNVFQSRKNSEIIISLTQQTKNVDSDGLPVIEKGRELFLRVSSSIIRFPERSRENDNLLLLMQDSTQSMQVERIRKDFVANVSHELKTPITSIMGFVETLQEGALEEKDQALYFLSIIARHTGRINSIIDDLLSLSKLEESEGKGITRSRSSLKRVIDNAFGFCRERAREKSIELSAEQDKETFFIYKRASD